MKIENIYARLEEDNKNPYYDLGRKLVEDIDLYGLGVQPKSDLEALIFHCICNAIEGEYSDNILELDYVLMQILRISPAKLRNLRVIRSAKFLNNLDWHDAENQERIINALKHAPVGNADIENGIISVVISDPHTQNLIERMVEDNKGVLDKTFSSKVLRLNSKQFLEIVVAIYGDGADDGYDMTIKAIKDEAHKIREELTKDNIFEEFNKAFKEHAFKELIELGGKVAMKAIKKRLLG